MKHQIFRVHLMSLMSHHFYTIRTGAFKFNYDRRLLKIKQNFKQNLFLSQFLRLIFLFIRQENVYMKFIYFSMKKVWSSENSQ